MIDVPASAARIAFREAVADCDHLRLMHVAVTPPHAVSQCSRCQLLAKARRVFADPAAASADDLSAAIFVVRTP